MNLIKDGVGAGLLSPPLATVIVEMRVLYAVLTTVYMGRSYRVTYSRLATNVNYQHRWS